MFRNGAKVRRLRERTSLSVKKLSNLELVVREISPASGRESKMLVGFVE